MVASQFLRVDSETMKSFKRIQREQELRTLGEAAKAAAGAYAVLNWKRGAKK